MAHQSTMDDDRPTGETGFRRFAYTLTDFLLIFRGSLQPHCYRFWLFTATAFLKTIHLA